MGTDDGFQWLEQRRIERQQVRKIDKIDAVFFKEIRIKIKKKYCIYLRYLPYLNQVQSNNPHGFGGEWRRGFLFYG